MDDQHRFQWHLTQGGDVHASEMMRAVTSSNLLRRSSAAFTSGDLKFVHEDARHTVLAMVRASGDDTFLCIMNLSDGQWDGEDYCVQTGCGGGREWRLVLNSQSKKFGGWVGSCSQEVVADDGGGVRIRLPKWACVVYKAE